MIRTINLGCGNDSYGDVRVDVVKTKTTTHVFDLNQKFPFKSEEFDVIYCREVLEHIMNLQTFISECYRILKPNGRIELRTDNASYLFFHIKLGGEYGHPWKSNGGSDGHYHLFRKEHLERLFKDFTNVKISYRYGGRNWLMNYCLRCLGELGSIGFDLEAEKYA